MKKAKVSHKPKMKPAKKDMKGEGLDKSKKEYGSMDRKPLSKMPKRGRGKDIL